MASSLDQGLANLRAGDLAGAEAHVRRLLETNPDDHNALHLMGMVHLQRHEIERGIGFIRKALDVRPKLTSAWSNLGVAHFMTQRYADARDAFEQALRLEPENAWVRFNLANAHYADGSLQAAADHYGQAFEARPDFHQALALHIMARRRMCDWDKLNGAEQRLCDAARTEDYTGPVFTLLALADDPGLHRNAAHASTARLERSITPMPHTILTPPGAKVRVAYVSSDFRTHAVAHLIAGVIEAHDRSAFEIYGLSYGADTPDDMRARLAASFDRFVDVNSLSDAAVASFMRDHGIDIAVDLTGHTGQPRPGIFLHRPCPIQINYLGYPGTMGSNAYDFILADRIVVPEDQQPNYAEKIIHLPTCYQPSDPQVRPADAPVTRAAAGLPDGAIVLASFNSSYKLGPELFACWMKILKAQPKAVLWLLQDNPWQAAHLAAWAAHHGVDRQRIIFAPKLGLADHLSRHTLADIFLDTFPYGAHTTASDALRMGLPIVTLQGQSFASRVASSLLTAVGLTDMVTTSPAQYESLVIRLATDATELSRVRSRLREGIAASGLFDTAGFCRGLEATYLELLSRRRATMRRLR